MKKNEYIALIGAGELGSRHLQGLLKSRRHLTIYVVDPYEESLLRAEKRCKEVLGNDDNHKVIYSSSMDTMERDIDLAIIATSSGPRRSVLESLLERTNTSYLVMEKFLFQSIKDYDEVGEMLEKRKIQAWVNCARRLIPIYQELRNEYVKSKYFNMSVSGGNWGLGCNGIHMLDLYTYLCGGKLIHYDTTLMDEKWIDSKRKGYIEFTGQLSLDSSKGVLSLCSYNGDATPIIISFSSDKGSGIIDESKGIVRFIKESNKDYKEEVFSLRFQSDLTGGLADEILETGKCELPSYQESAELHKCLLNAYLEQYNKSIQSTEDRCPIT